MKTVWKYPIPFGENAAMPAGARIVHVAKQDATWMMWAVVDSDATPEARHIHVAGTGHQLPDGAEYIGTFMDTPFVWHVFELPLKRAEER